ELSLGGDVDVPGTRFRVNATYWTSDPQMGSDFRYRRTRVTVGGDLSVGRHFALVPQATYGLVRGQVLPQDVMFLGGVANLRTLKRNARGGGGRVTGRPDLLLVDELGKLLHLPLPAWMPLQLGSFVGTGAVWGRDPVTGAAVPTTRYHPN